MQELKINPEFARLLPPLTEDEFTELTENLIENGCREPIVTWGGTIIDGHHRYKICTANHIKFTAVEMVFETVDDAKWWIVKNQTGRRNISSLAKIELATKIKPVLVTMAKARQGTRNDLSPGNFVAKLPQSSKRVRDELAEQAGVSGRTFDKGVYVLENADEETKDRLRRGEKGLSISGVYNDLKAQEALENQTDDIPVANPEDEEPFVPDPNSTTPNIPRPDPKTAEEIKATIKANPDMFPRNQVTLKNISKDDPGALIGALMLAFDDTYIENLVVSLMKELFRKEKTKLAKRIVKEVNTIS